MSDRSNRIIIWYSIILGLFSMAVMLYYSLNKEIKDKIEPQKSVEEQLNFPGIDGVYDDIYQKRNLHKPLTFSLPSMEVAEQAVLIEKFANHCVQICFEGLPEDYFENTKLTGNVDGVKDIICQYKDGKTIVSIYLTEVFACLQKTKDRDITLDFKPLREVYDKIIVIDPGHGGEDVGNVAGDVCEKDINLSVVLKLKELMDKTDIKVLYTRLEDETIDNQARIILANEVNADLFLSVHCGFEQIDETYHGVMTYYNDTFFIPDFGNADLAYIVEEQVAGAVSGLALGLKPGEKDNDLLKNSMVPTACIEVGYLSNEVERENLKQYDYVNKIACGLYNSIVSSYEQMIEQ